MLAGPPINPANIVASPSPKSVLLRPGSLIKFFPTTWEFVVISPKCSINTAMTTGQIVIIAEIENAGSWNLGTATIEAWLIRLVSTTFKHKDNI